jgi:hypothetical protein
MDENVNRRLERRTRPILTEDEWNRTVQPTTLGREILRVESMLLNLKQMRDGSRVGEGRDVSSPVIVLK